MTIIRMHHTGKVKRKVTKSPKKMLDSFSMMGFLPRDVFFDTSLLILSIDNDLRIYCIQA